MESVRKTQWQIKISKEELASLPAAEYNGEIIVVSTQADAESAAEALEKETVIGFDTETKPSFKKGQSNDVSLLQLSSRKVCFLFRLNHIGLIPELKALLENPKITKIGLSIHDDFHNLKKIFELNPDGFIDLQSFVKDYKISDNSLSKIYAVLFNKRISKGQRLSNWESETLSQSQRQYAALDARACVDIYDFLNNGCFKPEESVYKKIIEQTEEEED